MNMIDKIDKLLLDLEDSEVLDEFVNEYHDFIDEDLEKSCTKFSKHISHDFTDNLLFDNFVEFTKDFGKIFDEYVLDINFDEILNAVTEGINKSNQYDNDYIPENITEFKLKINADTINYTNLTNAA
ncbi:hypothetical protein [Enterococcus sp. BWR-S5]|uniref:hypothetical protein n=1 Tax=Enterococcus sp. BWR-S5 TaxID=2787714 RepID=UPI00192335F0|nr:hypothetical protein [Enterococcus sp. BWR-S5]MBL1225354.1 hypothetical protein [Enterococcus sp. BWR-S5]